MSKKLPLRFLITGGCGFIGSALVRFLIKKTNKIVFNVDKLTYASNLNSLDEVKTSDRYNFFKSDICNQSDMYKVILKSKPNIICNLAAETHVDNSIQKPKDFIRTNIFGTFNLLEATKKYYYSLIDKRKFVFHHISTDEVYGELRKKNKFFTENSKYYPNSPYAASKASSDHLVRAWQRTYNIPIIITNCSNNYGPYQNKEKLIPLMILNAIRGKKLPIYGDGKQIRDWLYVDDHVRALYKVATKGKIGETYNIGSNNEMKNIDLVKHICNLLDSYILDKPKGIKSFSQLISFVKDRKGHDRRYAIDARKIYKDLGWKPKESFETGIKKTMKWFLQN